MLIFRLLAAIALVAPLATHAFNKCNWPYGEYSALEELCPFSEGLAAIKIRNAWGYVDRQGKLAVAPSFEDVEDFSGNYAAVSKNGKWGFIDHAGNVVVPLRYSHVSNFSEGLASAEVDDKTGYIDASGQWVIAPQFSGGSEFHSGVAVVETNAGYALINKQGEFVRRFTDDLSFKLWGTHGAQLRATRKFAPELIGLDGRRRLPPKEAGSRLEVADDVYFVSDRKDDETLYGIMDQQGHWVVEPKFHHLYSYHDGLAIAKLDEAQGAIDKSGKFVIPAIHTELERDDNGYYIGSSDGSGSLTHVYDKHGKPVFSGNCGDATYQTEGEWTILKCGNDTWVGHKDGFSQQLAVKDPKIESRGELLLVTTQKENSGEKLRDIYLLAPGKLLLSSQSLDKAHLYDSIYLLAGSLPPPDASTDAPIAVLVRDFEELTIVRPNGSLLSKPDWKYESELLDHISLYHDDTMGGPLVFQSQDAWGAIDGQGAWVVSPEYRRISRFRHGFAFADTFDDRVLIDRQGREIELPSWRVTIRDEGIVTADAEDGKLLAYRVNDGVAEPIAVDGRLTLEGEFIDGLIPAQKNGLWGLLDREFHWVIEPFSTEIPKPLLQGKAMLGWKVGKSGRASGDKTRYGLLDPRGKLTIPLDYDEVSVDTHELGLIAVTYADDHHGLLRPDGRVVVPPEYESIDFQQDWLVLKRHEQLGLVDTTGEWLVAPDRYTFDGLNRGPYSHEKVLNEERLVHSRGMVSTRAKPVAWPEETASSWWSEVVDDGRDNKQTVFYGFDWKERLRLPGVAKTGFFDGWAVVERRDAKKGLYLADTTGKQVGPLPYDTVSPPSGGLSIVTKHVKSKDRQRQRGSNPDELYGFIDTQGHAVIPPRFELAIPFSDGRSEVLYKGNLGIIDNKGKLLLHSAWRCGKDPVLLDGKGTVIWPANKSGC